MSGNIFMFYAKGYFIEDGFGLMMYGEVLAFYNIYLAMIA